MPNLELKRHQLGELYRRLENAHPAKTDEEGTPTHRTLMKQVGDELTDEPYDPTQWKEHDRIYPPQPDREQIPSGIAGARLFFTLKHEVIIGLNGAIAMRKRRTREIEFTKAGHDGQEIAL